MKLKRLTYCTYKSNIYWSAIIALRTLFIQIIFLSTVIYIYIYMKMYTDENTQDLQRMILLEEIFASFKFQMFQFLDLHQGVLSY